MNVKTISAVLLAAVLMTGATIVTDVSAVPKQPKTQARINVTIDGTNIPQGPEGTGNSSITVTVGGHTTTKPINIKSVTTANQTQANLSLMAMPFNFNKISAVAGDEFSVCFNSGVEAIQSSCEEGVLVAADIAKGKGNKPTKLIGDIDLTI